jgi:tripartite-type tricarboxylate transporter receptor subunit TctC
MKRREQLQIVVAFVFVALQCGAVGAQDYPTKPVIIVLGLAAGTGLDMVARTYGEKLSQSLGRPVVFDNRPGAASIVAITALKTHPADGHALLVVTSGALAINRTAFKQLPYDPVKDFVPLSVYLKSPFILIVHPSLPVKSVPELIKFVKARPGQLTFSSSGLTGASRLSTELMSNIFGLQMTHVPYRNSHNSIMDVAAGNVQLAFAEAGATQSLIRDGRLRALAVSAQTRLTTFPEIPTMAEASGRPDFEAVSWHCLVAPSATPAAVVNRLHGEMTRILKLPDVRDRIVSIGLIPQEPRSIEENRQYIASETKKWGEVITKLGLAGSQGI